MTCSVPDCERPRECRGMCNTHYERARREGSIVVQPKRRDEFVEDLEWIVAAGETNVEAVSSRLGTNPRALERRLQRAGRGDLIERINGFYREPGRSGRVVTS